MYDNLRAEMTRRNVTAKEIAKKLGKTEGTISGKITGKTDFTMDEARQIKDILSVNITLDELFLK